MLVALYNDENRICFVINSVVSFDYIASKSSYTSEAYPGHILHNALQISVSDAEN